MVGEEFNCFFVTWWTARLFCPIATPGISVCIVFVNFIMLCFWGLGLGSKFMFMTMFGKAKKIILHQIVKVWTALVLALYCSWVANKTQWLCTCNPDYWRKGCSCDAPFSGQCCILSTHFAVLVFLFWARLWYFCFGQNFNVLVLGYTF